jgi:hypothetical protein
VNVTQGVNRRIAGAIVLAPTRPHYLLFRLTSAKRLLIQGWAECGEFATDEQVRAVWGKHGLLQQNLPKADMEAIGLSGT